MITRVGIADLDVLLPLMRGYCDFYEVEPSDQALRALSLTLIEHPDTAGVQLIARDEEDDAIGFATIYWSYSTLAARAIGVMNDLYVTEAARGRGLGAELIGACEVECAARGIEILEWETATDNARAQSVYERFGATRSEWVSYTLPVTRR
jgi:GNAT superfamily N-acetyltransferase